jgi:RNA methyltransferase, TrmH family
MTSQISSLQNPKIKCILALSKSGNRKKDNIFIIEGFREIGRATLNKVDILSVFYCPEIIDEKALKLVMEFNHKIEIFEVSRQVYTKIAYRENVDGLIVLARPKELSLDKLKLGNNPLIMVLESVEKPGNLGALLRTADAAAIDAVLICDTQTDIYNPNVVRSSVGCLFSNQVVLCDTDSVIKFLQRKKIRIYTTALQDAIPYTQADFTCPSAIIMGSEAKGLSQKWRQSAEQIIKIPMAGIADSLNVSVSAAILVFEAIRQRRKEW